MQSNEISVVKAKIMSIVSSLRVMDEEKENIKDHLKDLKDSHQITPKVARAVAKIIHKGPDEDADKIRQEIDDLVSQLSV